MSFPILKKKKFYRFWYQSLVIFISFILFNFAYTIFFHLPITYARIACEQESYTQCGTAGTECPANQQFDSSYEVSVDYSNSSLTTCKVNCYGSHVSGQCNWTGCKSGYCIEGDIQRCSQGYSYSTNPDDQTYCAKVDYAGECCVPSGTSGAPTSSCGAGNNNGSGNGTCGTDGNVYYCYQYAWHLKTTCSSGCQTNPPGVADTCNGSSSGPSGSNPTATPTQSNNSSNPTDTPIPSNTPTATPAPPTNTPTGPIHTTANLTVHIEGIDSANIPNLVPAPGLHGKSGWPFILSVYKANQSLSSTPYQTYTDTMQEITDPTSPFYGMFQNTSFKLYDAYKGLPSGDYKFVIRTPVGSLRKQIGTKTFTINAWTSNSLISPDPENIQQIPTLLMGDLNGDNKVDTIDLNILFDCYGDKGTQQACNSDRAQIINSYPSLYSNYLPGDLNDNGKVDGIDFNTLLSNFNS
ncbi:MAG TPA: hypothetical protein VF820_01670, partial [Patescibacteria group bacterium]